ncbi:FkbM family methyltransferase [Mucilaginibacter boryungensis]|uniref:FkbM family methyltransferase n=1 Tax=Mucilaginibacter boryungensis TaxID=768480 RepID=A0ABR9XF24_9SPHI|nr:FkbM family methyltransferase [Mucilaginibacter boryungensis]MBE9665987.1 FkbM family methyltransferase [Mucilaginibacter boryungensis]
MKRADRIKLDFTRNWRLPGKERLANLLKTSADLKVSLQNGIVWLTDEDIAIHTTADNYIEYAILSTGTYEAEIGKLIRTCLKPGYVALDIGANIGLQSIRMSQCCGDEGIVLAFEPLNYLQEKFRKNIALNNCTNVKLLPFALSDNETVIDITINENNWNQGTFSLNHTTGGDKKQQLTVKIGDKVEEIEKLAKLHLVKIDVEGFEFHVLRGLKATLQKHRPRLIFEYDSNYWSATHQQITACYDFLIELGYTVYQITQVGCELIKGAAYITNGNLFCLPVNNA